MDTLRLRPSLLSARPGAARPRDHFLPPFRSIQRNGKAQVCFSSQRTQGPTLYHSQKFIDWKSSYCRISRQSISTSINASGQQLQSEPEAHDSASIWRAISSSLDAFYRFSRPHTVIGTALSIVSVSLLAVQSLSDISPLFLTGLLEAVVAALFMNIYIVGLNQIFDIEIDKVNKPTLPLASGEYTPATGVAIVSVFAAMSFGLGWAVGSQPLFWALFISFVLGTAYSINLPYFRWKRFAVVAALCILAVRAVIVQLAFFLHIQTFVFKRPAAFTRPLLFATGFMTFFSVVIALFKDIPDIEGDRIFGIRSFSVRLGQKKVFWICVGLLEMAYSVAILMGATSTSLWSKTATIAGHSILAAILWSCARSVDLTSKAAITSFYMFIWKWMDCLWRENKWKNRPKELYPDVSCKDAPVPPALPVPNCDCGKPAHIIQSTYPDTAARAYYLCGDRRPEEMCYFFQWIDGPEMLDPRILHFSKWFFKRPYETFKRWVPPPPNPPPMTDEEKKEAIARRMANPPLCDCGVPAKFNPVPKGGYGISGFGCPYTNKNGYPLCHFSEHDYGPKSYWPETKEKEERKIERVVRKCHCGVEATWGVIPSGMGIGFYCGHMDGDDLDTRRCEMEYYWEERDVEHEIFCIKKRGYPDVLRSYKRSRKEQVIREAREMKLWPRPEKTKKKPNYAWAKPRNVNEDEIEAMKIIVGELPTDLAARQAQADKKGKKVVDS